MQSLSLESIPLSSLSVELHKKAEYVKLLSFK